MDFYAGTFRQNAPQVICIRTWYLVCYDIRDDSRLRRVANIMRGYGRRLQYSVYGCYLSKRDTQRMRWELTKVLDAQDGLLIVSLCKACTKEVRVRNPTNTGFDEPPNFVIL